MRRADLPSGGHLEYVGDRALRGVAITVGHNLTSKMCPEYLDTKEDVFWECHWQNV